MVKPNRELGNGRWDRKLIENIISTSTKICEDIGLKNESNLMDKCVLTLIKKHKLFKN